jgi:hypothetical protein
LIATLAQRVQQLLGFTYRRKMCQGAPLKRSWMLRPGEPATENRKIYGFLAGGGCLAYKTQHYVTGLRQSLQGFQNTSRQVGFVQTERKS